jgi:acetate kinase
MTCRKFVTGAGRGEGVRASPIALALNSGSSSLKFGLYRVGPKRVEELLSETIEISDQKSAMAEMAGILAGARLPSPSVIGHRIVHGGPRLRQHCLIDDAVLGELEAAVPFAPLHLPSALDIIRFSREHFPGLPQAACFDTTFHADLPDVARVLPLPKVLRSEGVQRYGFHGLSCESIVDQLGVGLPDRVIVAHLGNGASVTAVKAGKSIDTTMGLTPTGGVIMGSRTGDMDPGVLVYLMRHKPNAHDIEDLVDRQSGLLGISGVSGDMRVLHAAARSNPDAALAIEMFCYVVRKQLAAMISVLDGVDLMVFTGGIGEHDVEVRATICKRLGWAGVVLDDALNRASNKEIGRVDSACKVFVLPSLEDEQIARHACALIGGE